ncbi:MAG: hypothetical protein HYZ42_07750, partial [Bacteroidetes bacterium]|nr:hypothetical protein [Bacteroidota bacterium]
MTKRLLNSKFLLLIFATAIVTTVNAQINYKASNASNFAGTWTDVGTNGSNVSMANFDDANSSPEDIGFNFVFNGTTYNKMIINTNGFIKLGSVAPSSANLFYSSATNTVGGALAST